MVIIWQDRKDGLRQKEKDMGLNTSWFLEAENIDEILCYWHRTNYDNFQLKPEEVRHIIRLAGGFWQHNGDSKAPHVVLRSGKHSDGFIAVTSALQYVTINDLFAISLANKILRQYSGKINWVVGSDHAAAIFSYAVACQLQNRWYDVRPKIKYDFSEKVVADGLETQKWARHTINLSDQVLQVEELCTTNLTLKRVREGIAKAHPYAVSYAPVIGMAVNRTGSEVFEESKIVSLLDIRFNEWQPAECPLCANGSEALENVKKSAATWAKLTGRSVV